MVLARAARSSSLSLSPCVWSCLVSVDFVIQGLEFGLLGLVLPLQIGKAALALVGLRDGDLETR